MTTETHTESVERGKAQIPHRLAVAASRAADMGYPFAGPLVIIDPIE